MASITLLGYDASGSANSWAPVNFSLTPYSYYDSMSDVPGIATTSLTSDSGGVVRGNYNTWNPLTNTRTGGTISSANLRTDGTINTRPLMLGTQYFGSGKWYCEVWVSNYGNSGDNKPIGITTIRGQSDTIGLSSILLTYGSGVMRAFANSNNNSLDYRDGYGNVIDQGAGQSWWVDGFWVGFAVDVDNNTMAIYKNGSLSGKVTNCALAGKEWTYFWEPESSASRTPATGWFWNFGQQPFVYTPPAGHKGLCTTNLPNPVIRRPSDHFDIKTYTGNGTSLIVGVNPKQLPSASINKSLKFKSSIKAYLTRTPSSASNRQTWTWSGWVKRGLANTRMTLMGGYTGTTNGTLRSEVILLDGGALQVYSDQMQTATDFTVVSNQLFRDTNTWYHFVAVLDTTNTSSANRVRMYVNGVQITSFSTATYPAQNYQGGINYNNLQYINRFYDPSGGNYYGDGYLADVNFIDGQALAPTSFGQFDANNNWVPKTYSGTYGTNGYKLDFNDTRSPTTAAYDVSGNSNHWTPLIETGTASAGWNTAPTAANAPNVLYYGTPGTYTWTAPAGVTSVTYLVVGGGGGGGDGVPTRTTGAGGGAGGYLTGTLSVTPSTSYTVTVGAGGLPGTSPTNGGNSVFASITALGGGYGAYGGQNGAVGGTGGSGGGSSGPFAGGTYAGGLGTAGQGNNGGVASQFSMSGGGGAGAAGSTVNGGNGLANTITGVSVYYAGGSGVVAGLGGGGRQADNPSSGTAARPGTDGLGGGGGGGSNPTTSAARGGSGVVILSYTNAGSYVGAGAGSSINNDSSLDVPVNTIDSLGNSIGNFATWSTSNQTVSYYTTATLSEGGLVATGGAINTSWNAIGSLTIPTTGKWYWEVEVGATVYGNGFTGITGKTLAKQTGWRVGVGILLNDGNTGYTYTSYNTTSPNRVGIAYDADAGKMWVTDISGTWLNSKTPGVDTTGLVSGIIKDEYVPFWTYNSGAETNLTIRANFGQSPFAYTQPTGFKSLNTKNLSDVGISNLPDNYGNFVNTPDLVWTKARSGGAVSPRLYDTARGPGVSLGTNSTGASGAETNQGLSAFLPNGFLLTSPNGAAPYGLENGYTYVAWCWNRGQIPGFDIVTYGGDGTGTRSIAHNLGQTPSMVIVKGIGGTRTGDTWRVKHKNLSGNYNLELASTSAQFDVSAATGGGIGDLWGSTNFQVRSGSSNANNVNESGTSYIAYLWAEVPGFSKFGSYVGNGAADGPFIYTGFRPKYLMIKRIDAVDSWIIEDSVRNTANPNSNYLLAESSAVEGSTTIRDFYSNGFKCRATAQNTSGGTYIYVAFAEAPFKYANAR